LISSNSASVRRPGLLSTSSGTFILPMSWSSRRCPLAQLFAGQPRERPKAIISVHTLTECRKV
jgi:hypothetical protein